MRICLILAHRTGWILFRGLSVCCFLGVLYLSSLQAQISVSGAAYVEAKEDKINHLRVMVLSSPMASVTFSGPAGGQLYRYATKASEAELVSEAELGTDGRTWSLRAPTCDRGYFVRKEGEQSTYYWLVDYTAYPLPMQTLEAYDAQNVCQDVHLAWTENLREITYYTPLGVPQVLSRRVALQYKTLRYTESSRTYSTVDTTIYIEPKGREIEVEASLMDTDYAIVGDAFVAPLGATYQPVRSGVYLTKRIDLHPYVDLLDSSGSIQTQKDGDSGLSDLSAPQEVRLSVVANEPVTVLYNWSIYPTNESVEAAILRFAGRETNYTFRQAGKYTITVEVTNRDGSCADRSFARNLQIRESMLDVPNAFSPGSSPGVNDVFRVKSKSLVKFEASVFDRNGQRVCRWTDPAGGWDGYIRGRLAPTGTYFYVINAQGADGHKYNLRGHINVLRGEEDGSTPNESNQPTAPTPNL